MSTRQALAQGPRQVAHVVERSRAATINPLRQLASAKRRLAHLFEKGFKFGCVLSK
jgi:hypothetical protein